MSAGVNTLFPTVTLSVAWGVAGVVGVVGVVGVFGVLVVGEVEPPPPHDMTANSAGARKRMCRFRIWSPMARGGIRKNPGADLPVPGPGRPMFAHGRLDRDQAGIKDRRGLVQFDTDK